MNHLNDQQKACINDTKDLLVIACAGSGKTRLIVEKINNINGSIFCSTYTNVGANEIKSRLINKNIHIGTFHSLCYKILINNNISLESNPINFEEILDKTLILLDTVDIKYDYVIIDEFQDSSEKEWLIMNKLKHKQLFCVGDDDQNIFAWRTNFSQFPVFKNIKYLEINYRCTEETILVAKKILEPLDRYPKKLYTVNNGDPIKLYICNNQYNCLKKKIKPEDAILGRTNYDIQIFKNLPCLVSTIHGAKGMQFNDVYIVNINSIPFYKSTEEEERRLFYVALTRAKNNVYLLYDLNGKWSKESIFIKEIENLINIELDYN